MYDTFDFKNVVNIHNEIVSISKIEDDDEAIIKAFHFQRYYAKAIKNDKHCTGYDAILTALKNIRYWIGNEDPTVAKKINYLWGNIPS